ncbi:MAG: acylphosphatase [Burkholderiales bacterium]|nr:acylphosphatase [Burkholderiales bacterium]
MTERAATITRKLRIFGKVQGVGYRAAFCDEATRQGVTGWVRNRLDGSVEALVQADATTLDRLTQWARKGPRLAAVSHVDVTEASADEAMQRFNGIDTLPTR